MEETSAFRCLVAGGTSVAGQSTGALWVEEASRMPLEENEATPGEQKGSSIWLPLFLLQMPTTRMSEPSSVSLGGQ